MPNAQNRYLTLTEAAEYLRVSPRTLARWARRRKVPATRTPGGHWRFYPPDLTLALTPVRDTTK